MINLQKLVLHPVKQTEFLGLVIDTEKMTFTLSEKKLKHGSQQYQDIFKQTKTSVLNLTKLIGQLSSIFQAILLARIQFRYLQQEQILALQKKRTYSGRVTLGNLGREELLWWMIKLKLCNGKKIQQREPTPYDHSDRCHNKMLEGILQGGFNKGKLSKEEKNFHINVLELLALQFPILTFTRNLSYLTIHVQVDNKVGLAYLLKMGGTRSPQLLKNNKSIWNYLLSHQITITAEYLLSRLNVRAN